jgi:hypothetical protein
LEDKIRVYVCSLKGISTLDFADKGSMGHPCAVEDGGADRVFSGFKNLPVGSWDGCLSEDQIRVVDTVREFCQENQLEYEIVDVANSRFTGKMKFAFKGIRAPAIVFKGKKIEGVPTKEDLEVLIAK